MNEETSQETVHGLDQGEIELFIGKKSQYYLGKWKKAQDPEKKAGWNWAGFMGGLFWLGYRKMYLYVMIFIGLYTVIGLMPIGQDNSFNSSLGMMTSMMTGMLGNVLYFNHTKQKINRLKTTHPDHETVKAEIAKAGGGSWLGVGLVGLMLAVSAVIVGLSAILWGE